MSTNPEDSPKPKRNNRRLLVIAAVAIFACAACGLFSLFLPDGDMAEETAPVVEVAVDEPTAEPPAATEPPTAVPATLAPVEALQAAVASALGSGNRDVERLAGVVDANGRIEVDWAINDNVSEELLQGGAQLDAAEILKAIAASGYEYDFILMRGTYPLVDQGEQKVVELFFSRETVDGLDFSGFFDHRNIYEIADSAEIHPAFVRE